MSEPTVKDVVDSLGNLTVVELIALTKELEEKWGVEAKPQLIEAPVVEEVKPVQTEFTVVLASVPADKKIGAIKVVREVMLLGLKEAKEFVESVPRPLKESVSLDEANALKTKLVEAGLVVEVK